MAWTPEVIVAVLSSPVIVAAITLFFRWREAQHKRRVDAHSTSFTRLEAENIRLAARIQALEDRIAELREQGDRYREEIHALQARVARLRRRMIELGVEEAVSDG